MVISRGEIRRPGVLAATARQIRRFVALAVGPRMRGAPDATARLGIEQAVYDAQGYSMPYRVDPTR